ncbi:hypothetical protein DFH07DRAFT_984653 [Mycena maculata]|uniref:Uncharacterized protein n=1 Tax=Mycena maculata TaxID=230809 RepID=A0AAD7K0J4_9AGAR|nr:hypothetical protein DFH07DRAFT_984653 [Mycena maculata]
MASSALPEHPCYLNPEPKSKLKPDTTVTTKYIKVRACQRPPSYPYQIRHIGDGGWGRRREAFRRNAFGRRRPPLPTRVAHSRSTGAAKAEVEDEKVPSSDEEFYPPSLKKARLGYPSSASWSPDVDVGRLLEEQSKLEMEKDRLARKHAALVEKTNAHPAQRMLQRLEKEYNQYHSISSLTEAEFEARITDLHARLDAAKASTRAKELERADPGRNYQLTRLVPRYARCAGSNSNATATPRARPFATTTSWHDIQRVIAPPHVLALARRAKHEKWL